MWKVKTHHHKGAASVSMFYSQVTDSPRLSYSNFGNNEPNMDSNSGGECVYMDGNSGEWHMKNCGESLPSICLKSKIGYKPLHINHSMSI